VASALYFGYLTAAPMVIGLYWWVCRPASRFGPLLVAFGVLAWVVSWEFSDWPLPFDVGVLVEGPIFWLTFYLVPRVPDGSSGACRCALADGGAGARGDRLLPPVGVVLAGDRRRRAVDTLCSELP
jgi:hypothetical protein